MRGVFGEAFEERLELGGGLGDGDAGFELEGDGLVDLWVLGELEREIERDVGPFEARRHDADDLVGLVDELDGAADDVGIAEVVALPEFVAEHDDGLRVVAEGGVGRDEPAAIECGHAPMIRIVGGDVGGLDVFGDVAVGGGEVPVVHADDAFDGFGLAELLDLRAVEAGVAGVAVFIEETDLHHAVGARVGEWVDEDGVNDGEDGACGADAEGERENGGQDEAGALAEFARGVLEVGEERLHG